MLLSAYSQIYYSSFLALVYVFSLLFWFILFNFFKNWLTL
jgi:hypothetical protein